jgi:hypothetical protein
VRVRPWIRYLAGTFLAGAGAWLGIAAVAQATGTINLTPPSSAAFPQIAFFASVIDFEGRSRHALPPTSFRLTEDGVAIDDFAMREETVGARQIYAVNTVAPLRRRDVLGVTRLEQVRQALIDSWTARPVSPATDQVSLLTADGNLGTNRSSAAALVPALEDWASVYDDSEVGYGVLMSALSAALDPLLRPGMETDIIFVTPLLDRNNELELSGALSMAQSSRARIHAVLVGTAEQAGTAEALRLRQAAEATGGSFRVFDPTVGFEDLETRLQEVRTRYVVEYASPAAGSGPHAVQLSVSTPDLAAVSDPVAYDVDLTPPQLTFIQPPQTIARRTDDPDTPLADIPPTFLDLPLLVTFPDGHARPIERLDLYVNGELHDTRLEAPFDRLRWDLSSIIESRAFQIRAEMTDSQGLTASTEIIPVSIEVVPGPRGLAALRPAIGPLFAGLGLVAAGTALTLGWFRLGELSTDPSLAGAAPGGMRLLRRASLGTRQAGGAPEAVLLPLHADGTAGPPIDLDGSDLMVGSDPALCGLLLDDPSVSGIHARLTRRAAGIYSLRDQHSVAGTWVNDAPVDESGRDLSHGDRIFFGRAAYRFRLAVPPSEMRVVVRPAAQGQAL